MNIHYFQHVPYEGLGNLEAWVNKPSHFVTATRFYENDRLPFIDAFDLLIVLGGPMSVGDEKQYPWLVKEKELIAKAIAKNKMVLGICLGSQLVAEVLGGNVYPNTEKEIGWFPLQVNNTKLSPLACLGEEYTLFHWHGDTYLLPDHAEVLASTALTPHQAFWVNPNVLGLQFHLECNEKTIAQFIENGKAELELTGKYIQTAEQITEGVSKYASQNASDLLQVLKAWMAFNGK